MMTRRLTALILAVACALPIAGATTPAHAEPGADLMLDIGTEGIGAQLTPTLDPSVDLEGAVNGVLEGTNVDLTQCEVGLGQASAAGAGSIQIANCAGSEFALSFDYVTSEGGALTSTAVNASNASGGGGPRLLHRRWYITCVWVFYWSWPNFGWRLRCWIRYY